MKFIDFLNESEDDLLYEADYGKMAAETQAKMQSVNQRLVSSKQKIADLTKTAQNYSERAGKSKDDISKAVYQSKISTVNARKKAYADYIVYLQSMTTYLQAKANEIDARQKSAARRKA